MMAAESIAPRRTDRAVFIGQTGCGKTTLARVLLATRPFVAVYDAKGLLRWNTFTRYTKLEKLMKAKESRLIYAPVAEELRDENFIEGFFRWVYKRRNTTLYVDEVYGVTKRDEIPPSYHACLTRGRELGISTFSATQRPMLIPQVVLSESEHYYIFRLLLPQDRKKMREVIGLTERAISRLGKHEFFYGNNEGVVRGPLKLNLSPHGEGESKTREKRANSPGAMAGA